MLTPSHVVNKILEALGIIKQKGALFYGFANSFRNVHVQCPHKKNIPRSFFDFI